MESYLIFFIALICISVTAAIVVWYLYRKINAMPDDEVMRGVVDDFEPSLKVSVGDIVKLANTNYIEQLDILIRESNVMGKLPAFYEKYLELNKSNKEDYFQNLVEVLGKTKQEYINELLNNHPEVSTQEILLLILMKAGIDNKTIARILFINTETLKKRKSRLKVKLGKKN